MYTHICFYFIETRQFTKLVHLHCKAIPPSVTTATLDLHCLIFETSICYWWGGGFRDWVASDTRGVLDSLSSRRTALYGGAGGANALARGLPGTEEWSVGQMMDRQNFPMCPPMVDFLLVPLNVKPMCSLPALTAVHVNVPFPGNYIIDAPYSLRFESVSISFCNSKMPQNLSWLTASRHSSSRMEMNSWKCS